VEAQHTLVTKVEVIQERLKKAYERVQAEKQNKSPETAPDMERVRAVVDAEAFEIPTEDTLPPLNDHLFEEAGIDMASDDVLAPASKLVDTQPTEHDAARASAGTIDQADKVAQVAQVDEAIEHERSDELEAPLKSEPAATVDPVAAKQDNARGGSPPSALPLTGSARLERVRQLQRDVKLHFQVRDWEHAVSLLYELVELEPADASHHGMLARAMARHPVMRKDAERHFIEALRLAPQNADLHFSLGLYYKSFTMHARAQTEFRTALRIRPQHEGAKKHLSPGGKGGKDPLKDMFKKIFG
jgi:Flp pilus assembly protein TadD